MKKLLSLLVIALCIILPGLWWAGVFDRSEVKIRLYQSEIDALLAKKFPLEKKYLSVIRITYTDPQASIVQQTGQVRIGITANIRAGIKPFEKEYQAKATLLCDIDYDPETHTFFLQQPVCESLELPKLPPEHLDLCKQALNLTAVTIWEKIPVYQWKPRDRAQELARMVLHDVDIEKDSLVFILKLPKSTSP